MRFTIYNTPIIIHLLRAIANIFLFLSRWRADDSGLPKSGSLLVIAAPHTSNWDFVIGLSIALKLHVNAYWVGKGSLFKGPTGPIMRWLGGIPLDRSKANNLVQTSINLLKSHDDATIIITPEGTRSWVPRWKTGFYHIATGANVPIALAYIDYQTKTGGVSKTIQPDSDMATSLAVIETFYASITPKHRNRYNTNIFDRNQTY